MLKTSTFFGGIVYSDTKNGGKSRRNDVSTTYNWGMISMIFNDIDWITSRRVKLPQFGPILGMVMLKPWDFWGMKHTLCNRPELISRPEGLASAPALKNRGFSFFVTVLRFAAHEPSTFLLSCLFDSMLFFAFF